MNRTLAELDKQHMLHPFTSVMEQQTTEPFLIQRGEGIRVYDDAGKEYIDAMAGLWCVNVGYGRQEIVEAVREQMGRLSFYHSFMGSANEPAIRLSARLAKLAPGALNHVFFCNSGSEANDTHVKIVRYYHNALGKPEKKKFISRDGGYHGVTLGAGSLSGLPALHRAFDLPGEGFVHVGRPFYFWDAEDGMTELDFSAHLARELEQRILDEGPETVAAFIAEPVMGAAGVVPPPQGYFEAIVPVLRKYEVLFVADEVICGFGRLGKMFGSDFYRLDPDLMTLAKGLTSGYVPMAACVVSDAIFGVLEEGSKEFGVFAHGFTYSGHPVAACAALASVDIIEREGLVDNAAQVGAYFQRRLREKFSDHPLVGEVRGIGLIAGIELLKDKAKKEPFPAEAAVARRLHDALLEYGLICRPILNTLAFSPPLILTRDDVDSIVERFAAGLDSLTTDLGI